MKQVCGRTLLDYHVSRLRRSKLVDRLVIATTSNSTDDPVAEFCGENNISYVRGSEDDVLGRYALAVKTYPADIIVRVTSDCPLIDPVVLDQVIRYFLKHRHDYDYVTIGRENFPRGLDVEVFSHAALDKAQHCAHASHEREHVTPYIYRKDSEFRCGIFPSTEKSGHHRWCVDEPADFELISNILTALGGRDDFSWRDCLAFVDKNPGWFALNSSVRQKVLTE